MRADERSGLIHGIAAYSLWGLFPLYFMLFTASGALEIVAHRAFWSLVFCLVTLAAMGRLAELRPVLANRRQLLWLSAGGLLIAVNWTTYVFGVLTGRTLDAALGYFINPLAVTALGVLVLGERLRPGQWLAVGFGIAAVIVLLVGYGEFPWVALTLAFTFGTYGLVKKLAGRSTGPLPGLAIETLAILPLSAGYIAYLTWTSTSTVSVGWYGALVATTGVVTAVPLLLFASAARSIPLVTVGMLQYLAPIGQFLVGWLLFGEPMPLSRWAGFVLVWIAILVFLVDALRQHHRKTKPAGPGP